MVHTGKHIYWPEWLKGSVTEPVCTRGHEIFSQCAADFLKQRLSFIFRLTVPSTSLLLSMCWIKKSMSIFNQKFTEAIYFCVSLVSVLKNVVFNVDSLFPSKEWMQTINSKVCTRILLCILYDSSNDKNTVFRNILQYNWGISTYFLNCKKKRLGLVNLIYKRDQAAFQ